MRTVPSLYYDLPRRVPGTLSKLPLGVLIEWLTTTWLRLNIFVSWCLVVILVLTLAPNTKTMLGLLALSPVAAAVLYLEIVVAAWIAYFIPGPNRVVGFLRLLYLWLFCRLVVQPAPQVEMPIWLGRR